MLADTVIPNDLEARVARRTNLFIVAVLEAAGGGGPARLRNMSTSGALAEGAVLPPPGSVVRLVRGSLSVAATVAWRAGGRCGLRFHSDVVVADWMSNSVHRAQATIDRVVADHKTGRAAVTPSPEAVASPADVREDLAMLGRLLDALSDALSGDPAVLLHHAGPIQNLDIAGQMVAALRDAAAADALSRSGAAARLPGLRASCAQALRA